MKTLLDDRSASDREDQTTHGELSQQFLVEADRLVREYRVGEHTTRSFVSVPADGTDPTVDPLGKWWRSYMNGCNPQFDGRSPIQKLRFAELFCGTGGLALGFSQACAELGFQPVSMAAADGDEDALAIYERHNQTRHTTTEDVSMLIDSDVDGQADSARFEFDPEAVHDDWASLEGRLDVLLAGPPCQGHSNLNNKTRREDWRNELYLTVPAMAVALDVPIIIIENVRSVLHDRQQVVQSSIRLFEEKGYHVKGGVLRAAEMGWPQTRERFFLIASRDSVPLPIEDVEAMLASPARSIWWAIEDLEHPAPNDFMAQRPEFSPENLRRIDFLHDNDLYDLPDEERPDCHQEGTTYNAVYGRLHADRPAPTITTGFMTPGRGRYIHPTQRRVLTAREAARIQGFPDDYDFRPSADVLPSKANLAKWIGDAVPMPLGHAATLAALLPRICI